MTLYQIINTLKQIALTQPNVKSATDGSVYEVMNANPSVKYNVVHFSQTTHQSDEEFDYYGLNIFYISRLEDSLEDNRLQIQSIGKEVLDNIIRTFCENWNIEFPTITYYPFTQKFADLCAGFYCNVRIEVPKEIICADDFIGEIIPSDKNIKLQDVSITITQNGLRVITPAAGYDGIGEITINTEVPQELNPHLEHKEVVYVQNGEYGVVTGPGYDGIESVGITVDVPSRYDEGYDDGEADQKAKLSSTSFTENSAYTSENGWSAVTVNVPSDVYNQSRAAQIGNENVTFYGEEQYGFYYESVTGQQLIVRPDSGYTGLDIVEVGALIDASGAVETGKNIQKAKLSSTSFTENSAYTSENGWSAVTVNVPTGQTINNQRINLLLFSRDFQYEDGRYECWHTVNPGSGYTGIEVVNLYAGIDATDAINDGKNQQKALLSSTSFTANDTYTLENGWSSVTVDIDDRYDEGYNDGVAEQKEKLSIITITENGTYENPDGYSSITVDVAQTGYTQQDIDDAYNRGYQDGLEACQQLPITATSITINVANTITDSGTATTTVNPTAATTNLTYSSSDTTKATINGTTGAITVKNSGSVTFCVRDSVSNLQSCKTVNVVKTPPSTDGALMIKYRVTSTTDPTQVVYTSSIGSFASYAISNGVSYNTNSKYITFPTTGDIWVYYILKDPTTCPANAFRAIDNYQHHYSAVPITTVEARLPNTIKYVGANCFLDQEYLSAVTLGESVQRMGRSAFTHCNSLQKLYVPLTYTGNSYTETVNGAVSIFGGNTKNVNVYYEGTITDWMTRIAFKGYASNPLFQGGKLYVNSTSGFSGTLVKNLTISSDICCVSDFAFDGCSSITSITISSGVTNLGYACFRNCLNLTGVTDNRTTPQTLATTWRGALSGTDDILQFYTTGTEYPIYVPANSVNTYKTATGWTEYADRIQAKP